MEIKKLLTYLLTYSLQSLTRPLNGEGRVIIVKIFVPSSEALNDVHDVVCPLTYALTDDDALLIYGCCSRKSWSGSRTFKPFTVWSSTCPRRTSVVLSKWLSAQRLQCYARSQAVASWSYGLTTDYLVTCRLLLNSISSCFRDIGFKRIGITILPFTSRDVNGHVTFRFPIGHFLLVVIWN